MSKLFFFMITLCFLQAESALAIPSAFTNIKYSCKMKCGKLSVGGGTCRGLQVAGEMSLTASGDWQGKHTEFIFSPSWNEYHAGVSCPADFAAKVTVANSDSIVISFSEGTYQVPQTCPNGSSITAGFDDTIEPFTLIAHNTSASAPTLFSAIASVERRVSAPKVDVYPDCEISFR